MKPACAKHAMLKFEYINLGSFTVNRSVIDMARLLRIKKL